MLFRIELKVFLFLCHFQSDTHVTAENTAQTIMSDLNQRQDLWSVSYLMPLSALETSFSRSAGVDFVSCQILKILFLRKKNKYICH